MSRSAIVPPNRVIDARSDAAKKLRLRGANLDINGSVVSGRDQQTGAAIQGAGPAGAWQRNVQRGSMIPPPSGGMKWLQENQAVQAQQQRTRALAAQATGATRGIPAAAADTMLNPIGAAAGNVIGAAAGNVIPSPPPTPAAVAPQGSAFQRQLSPGMSVSPRAGGGNMVSGRYGGGFSRPEDGTMAPGAGIYDERGQMVSARKPAPGAFARAAAQSPGPMAYSAAENRNIPLATALPPALPPAGSPVVQEGIGGKPLVTRAPVPDSATIDDALTAQGEFSQWKRRNTLTEGVQLAQPEVRGPSEQAVQPARGSIEERSIMARNAIPSRDALTEEERQRQRMAGWRAAVSGQ